MSIASRGGLEWITRDQLTHPTAGTVTVFRDHYWPIDADGRTAIYRSGRRGENIAPQCNTSQSIVKRHAPPGTVDVVRIPLAFIPHRCNG